MNDDRTDLEVFQQCRDLVFGDWTSAAIFVPLRVWIELSEDGTSWTIPGERVKNHRLHLLTLPPLARTIIANVARIQCRSGHIFTIGGGPVNGFSKAKARLDQLTATLARAEGRQLAAWRLHGASE